MKQMASIGGEMLGLRFTVVGVMDGLGLFSSAFSLGLAPPLLCYAVLLPLFLLAALGRPAPAEEGTEVPPEP